MNGSAKVYILILLFIFLGIVGYVGYGAYQEYQRAKATVDILSTVEANYRQFRSFTPGEIAQIQPILKKGATENEYISPLSPCMTLIRDLNWDQYVSSRQLLRKDDQIVLFDRFWNVVWLGVKPRDSTIVGYRFYGPFEIEKVNPRSFIEYVLLGRDVTQTNGAFAISLLKDNCEN